MPSLRVAVSLAVLCAPAGAQEAPNILLVIADDVGIYELASFGEGYEPAFTPTIDQLAAEGVSFPNCYANPLCTPTRATIQTGRYAIHTGVGTLLTAAWGMQPSEETLAETLVLSPGAYASGFFGKWHLTNDAGGGVLAPNHAGFHHAIWTMHNLVPPGDTYFHWNQIEDGVPTVQDGYVTSHIVDRALEWTSSISQPWLVVLSFHAAHAPLHVPPHGLYHEDLSGLLPDDPRPMFVAMIEALDTELGRFLEGIGPERASTHVIFVGDNGSPNAVIGRPGLFEKAKGSIWEGGINVPLIVSGPAVTAPGSVCSALVNTTDLFATALELGGVVVPPDVAEALDLSSISLVPYLSDPGQPHLRKIAYSDLFSPGGFDATTYVGAVRERRYKLIARYPPIVFELYDLLLDPFEHVNLYGTPLSPGAAAALQTLQADLLGKMHAYFD